MSGALGGLVLVSRSKRGVVVLALVAVCALVGSACAPGIVFPGGERRHGNGITVVAPPNGTQAPQDGEVALDVRLSRGLDPHTLRVWLIDGWPLPTGPARDISARLQPDPLGATAQLHAADLHEGITTVRAVARERVGGHTEVALSSFSWEPQVATDTADHCDVIDARKCLLPFPNDFFTVPDRSTPTGRRVAISSSSLPTNVSGTPITTTEWNRNDGFSPGAMIETFVPNLDLSRTGAAPITDIGASLKSDQPVVLLDADTGQRWPIWSELDAQADPPDARMLIIRPARDLVEGHRYIVALRDLRDANGAPTPAERGFALYRDDIRTFSPPVEQRRAHFESIFDTLRRAGIQRSSLDLAWDFTVASEQNLAGRMLHIRDDAFASLHGGVPSFTVDSVQNNVDSQIFRRVTGTFTVPNYLTGDGSPGNGFNNPPDAGPESVPQRNGNLTAGYICNIPRAATADGNDPVRPARGGIYGHGLLGSNSEVNAGNVETMSNTYDFVFCATKWAGFSEDDLGPALAALQDLSQFPKIADRTQQGFLNFLFLARLVKDPRGFASNDAFRAGASQTPMLDGTVFYDGNSQGGILGGAVTAIASDWTRSVLGVPGMNYSTLLQRSVDFSQFLPILAASYPDELDRMIGYSFLQMLWDRAEADGYAQHMTDDPYPGTPAHQVLMQVAFGDHQVANIAAETEARTIGASVYQPALAPGRSPDVMPLWDLPTVPETGWTGSVLVMWDSGNPPAPLANLPPAGPQFGADPHENPRKTPAAQQQKSDFLAPNGVFVDTCGHQPCLAPA